MCYGRKRQGPMIEECCNKQKINEILYGKEKMKTREEKRTIKLDFFFFFSKLSFWDIY